MKLSRVLDGIENLLLSSFVEVGLDVTIYQTCKNRRHGFTKNSKSYFLNLAIKRGVPSALLLLCPTGYPTEISSRTVPSFSSMVMAFPMDLFSGS